MGEDKSVNNVSDAVDVARSLDLERALGFLFRRLNSLASTIFAQTSAQTEITAMQAGILLTLYQKETLGLRDLAKHMHVDRSTLQEVVTRLVNRKLIGRRVPEYDRRTHELWLTAKGCELVLSHIGAMASLQGRLLDGIDPERAMITMEVLREILDRHDY